MPSTSRTCVVAGALAVPGALTVAAGPPAGAVAQAAMKSTTPSASVVVDVHGFIGPSFAFTRASTVTGPALAWSRHVSTHSRTEVRMMRCHSLASADVDITR